MEHSITIHFHIRNARKNENDPAPIYMRITINGTRYEQSINRWVQSSKWSAATGRMKGSSGDARALNDYIDILKNKVQAIEREMLNDRREINYKTFKEKWLGISVNKKMLLDIFKQHNDDVSKLIGKDC